MVPFITLYCYVQGVEAGWLHMQVKQFIIKAYKQVQNSSQNHGYKTGKESGDQQPA